MFFDPMAQTSSDAMALTPSKKGLLDPAGISASRPSPPDGMNRNG